MDEEDTGFTYANAREDGVAMRDPRGTVVLFTHEHDMFVTLDEALEAGLTVIEDLPERIPDVKRLQRRKPKWVHKDGLIRYTDRGEKPEAFLKRVTLTGEGGEHFPTNVLKNELRALGIEFGEDEFGEIWLEG